MQLFSSRGTFDLTLFVNVILCALRAPVALLIKGHLNFSPGRAELAVGHYVDTHWLEERLSNLCENCNSVDAKRTISPNVNTASAY